MKNQRTEDGPTSATEVKEITSETVEAIEVTSIKPSPSNPRRLTPMMIKELAESIKSQGVLQPITCRRINGEVELVFGHRRLLAAKAAGLGTIPVIMRKMTDAEVLEAQLVENVQRADVHPMDEAQAYEKLNTGHGLAVEEIAAKVGKGRGFIYGRMKLLALTKEARTAFLRNELTASVALQLARMPTEIQKKALERINEPWRRREDQAVSAREASRIIQREFMLKLNSAAFSKKDPELISAAGSCLECEKRTGNEPELFEDLENADVCTYPPCYKKKLDAHWIIASADAKARGDRVLSEVEAKSKFQGGTWLTSTGLMDLKDSIATLLPQEKNSRTQIGQFLKKIGAEYQKTIARDGSGNIRELVERKELTRALKAAGVKAPAERSSGITYSASEKRRLGRQKIVRAAADRAVTKIGQIAQAAIKSRTTGAAFWRLLLVLARPSVHSAPARKVLEGRGLKIKASASGDGASALAKKVSKFTEGEARAMLVELLLADRCEYIQNSQPSELKLAAAHFGVDLKKVERELAAEKKKKAPPASKKTRRSKTVAKNKRAAASKGRKK